MYTPEMVAPMNRDLTDYGFKGLENAEQVTTAIENMTGTALVVVNSVCGCAAGNARPGAKMSLAGDKKLILKPSDTPNTRKIKLILDHFPKSFPI